MLETKNLEQGLRSSGRHAQVTWRAGSKAGLVSRSCSTQACALCGKRKEEAQKQQVDRAGREGGSGVFGGCAGAQARMKQLTGSWV